MLIFYHHQLSKISSSYKKKKFNFYLVKGNMSCGDFWLNDHSFILILSTFYFLYNLNLFLNNVFLHLNFFGSILKQIE